MTIIPNPTEARELRLVHLNNPIVNLALAWLATNDVDHVRDVADVLPLWEHAAQLSDRERLAVLAAFVPPPAEACERCGRAVRYVTDGPDPGWWTHVDLNALLDGTTGMPHPAIPAYAA